jgi:hypothetical protein
LEKLYCRKCSLPSLLSSAVLSGRTWAAVISLWRPWQLKSEPSSPIPASVCKAQSARGWPGSCSSTKDSQNSMLAVYFNRVSNIVLKEGNQDQTHKCWTQGQR